MLRPEDIQHLRLDRDRYREYSGRAPRYIRSRLNQQLAAIGDSVVSALLKLSPEKFGAQLDHARQYGASWLGSTLDGRLMAVSATTSMIGDNDIIKKNVILPEHRWLPDDRLASNFLIGIFIPRQALSPDGPAENVSLAGWLDLNDPTLKICSTTPNTFRSNLRVSMVRCQNLNPMNELAGLLDGLVEARR